MYSFFQRKNHAMPTKNGEKNKTAYYNMKIEIGIDREKEERGGRERMKQTKEKLRNMEKWDVSMA